MTDVRTLLALVMLVLGLVVAPTAGASTGPVLSGSISNDPNLSGTTSVAVSGHFAYTTAYTAGELTAVDFSNPAGPVVSGSSAFSNGLLNASTVNIAGGFAYVVSKNRNGTNGSGINDDGTGNSLTILNISTNPAVPQIVGQVTDATKLFGSYGIAISGNYAYVAAQGCLSGQPCPKSNVGNSFEVVDVSNPASPIIKATLHNTALPAPWAGSNALSHACSVAISGHYAYVTAAYSNQLTIIDIANPLAPVIVSTLKDNTNLSFPVDVAVKGNYAYVTDQASFLGRVAVVDVSNPASPHITATVTDSATMNGAYRIRVSGNFAYVSGSSVATVTAIDISNPLVAREAAHVTDTAHLNKTTGLDVDPTGRYVVASSPYLSGQSNPTYPPFSTAAVTGTNSVITLDRTPIGVSITANPANPTTQTSASFAFASTDAISSMSCSLDGGPLGFCTSATTQQYAGLAPGPHTFMVQAADAAGNVASASYSWTIQSAPANTSAPSISGNPSQGSQLTASPGTWTGTPAPAFAYQWADCDLNGANCTTISGATSSTYSVQAADAGFTLEVTVTATNSVGSSAATSGPTAMATSPPVNTAAPSISGIASQGNQLTASPGTWTGTPPPTFAYQWSDCDANGANCNTISGATSATYSAQASDAGSTLEVTVTATSSAGSSSATSTPTGVVSSPPVNTAVPSISGTPSEGSQLAASPGVWAGVPAPTFAYQWSDCDVNGVNCTAISGASTSTYTAASSDVGSTLEVTVTATNSVGSSAATSTASAMVTSPPANTTPPSISGSPVEAQTLTASGGSWTGTPTPTLAYQWSDCNSSGASCNVISGANSSTYTALAANVGSTLKVTVTASNSVGPPQAASALTAVVTSAPGPVTSLLDNFNRANNGGPPSVNWSHMPVASTNATSNLLITGQQITGLSGTNGDYWNQQTFGANSEAWITVVTKPTTDQDPVVLGVRFTNPGTTTATGYQAYYVYRAASPDQYKISVRVNGVTTATVVSATGPTLKPGDKLLLRAIGSTLELWRASGTTWTRILSGNDNTITGGGYLMLSARNTAVRLDDFGGGTLP